jgi:hypothetical protein
MTTLLQTSIPGLPLLARGKVRDVYAVGDDKLLMVASFLGVSAPQFVVGLLLFLMTLGLNIISRGVVARLRGDVRRQRYGGGGNGLHELPPAVPLGRDAGDHGFERGVGQSAGNPTPV